MRSCSYTRKNVHRKKKQGQEVSCIQNGMGVGGEPYIAYDPEIPPFPPRAVRWSNPNKGIIRNLGFWQPSWVISSLLLSDSRRHVCCVARSISCCLFRASWGLGAWEESTIRSCSYTRMNPHRKEREGPEVPCVQNRWR